MKKRTLLFYLTGSLLLLYLSGCRDDLEDMNRSNAATEETAGGAIPVQAAKTWFGENNDNKNVFIQPSGLSSRAAENNILFFTQPSWKYFAITENEYVTAIDVDLTDSIRVSLAPEENDKAYRETGDPEYIRPHSRLVILTSKAGDGTIGFIMTVIPSKEYIDNHADRIRFITYLRREPGFEGLIVFHHLDGRFANGWLYENGKITQSVTDTVSDDENVARVPIKQLEVSYEVHLKEPSSSPSLRTATTVEGGMLPEVVCRAETLENRSSYYSYYLGTGGGGGSYATGYGQAIEHGGGGGYIPNQSSNEKEADKAKSIFRNSELVKKNWEKIEEMLDKIIADCLGEGLYNGLKTDLNGKTIAIEFISGDGSSFDYTTGKISLSMNMESNQLFHEMWHAYQAYQETQQSFKQSLLNQEMEAWYAQYLYVSSLPEYKQGSKWYELYNHTDLGRSIRDLKDYINNKGKLLLGDYQLNSYLDLGVQKAFREMKDEAGEYPYKNYPYDDDRTGSSNFTNLKNLSSNCN